MSVEADEVPPPLHALESEVMELMWQLQEAPGRTAHEQLNARSDRQRAYTTVMTILVRLDAKGLLSRRREGKVDIYKPTLSREEYHAAHAQAQVGALVDEYGDLALMHFAREMNQLDPERRELLRRLARVEQGP